MALIDLAALTSAVYERLHSGSAGADVRTFLPAGADAILLAQDVRNEALTIQTLPNRPIIALRRGTAPQPDRVVTAPIYTWYCYDDPSVGYGRLEQLPFLIGQAYESGLEIPTVGAFTVLVAAGAQTQDDKLHLLLQLVTVVVSAV
jgi:hypothetical protein